jgi:hypothetical protein
MMWSSLLPFNEVAYSSFRNRFLTCEPAKKGGLKNTTTGELPAEVSWMSLAEDFACFYEDVEISSTNQIIPVSPVLHKLRPLLTLGAEATRFADFASIFGDQELHFVPRIGDFGVDYSTLGRAGLNRPLGCPFFSAL